jgi:hypothetical protein
MVRDVGVECRQWEWAVDLKLLRLFLAVSSAGSFTKAAAGLSIAQPILSRQIRALERDVGVDLFYRNGRGIMLAVMPMPDASGDQQPRSLRPG